ncbi:hypothetical protein [Paenibacillus campi]|nr:hypothetical protein [Paenibacillus sp. SGZ-1009]
MMKRQIDGEQMHSPSLPLSLIVHRHNGGAAMVDNKQLVAALYMA